jgi:uracil-DNA glycosylase
LPALSSGLFHSLTPQWQSQLSALRSQIDHLERVLENEIFIPDKSLIFRALGSPIEEIKVLIVGQDPYPNQKHAMGLAFSVPADIKPLPPTLRNILKELESDIGSPQASHGDLTHWQSQGILLLNRVLTVREGESNSHLSLGWQLITDQIVKVLADRGVVSILWGKSAQEVAQFLNPALTIKGVHPSPLSAYRGFFGSKPFSKANALLRGIGKDPISW